MMSTRALAGLAAASGVLVLPVAGAVAATPQPAPPATVRVIVAPVTGNGHAAAGFTVQRQKDVNVSCAPAYASMVAIDANIEECSPSAAYAVACWKSATPHRALCLEDPRHKKLLLDTLTGKFAPTAPVAGRQRAPFVMTLTGGASCSIRIGGTGTELKSHPTYDITYYCNKGVGAVWLKPHGAHYGVDESADSWTVRTASSDGTGQLVTRHVLQAYFVATAPSP
jgi:hypothetical protein